MMSLNDWLWCLHARQGLTHRQTQRTKLLRILSPSISMPKGTRIPEVCLARTSNLSITPKSNLIIETPTTSMILRKLRRKDPNQLADATLPVKTPLSKPPSFRLLQTYRYLVASSCDASGGEMDHHDLSAVLPCDVWRTHPAGKEPGASG